MNMIRRNSMIGTSGTLQAATTGGAPVKKQRFKPQEKDLQILMGFFEKNPFPDRAQRTHLANTLGLEPKQILFWFQNRRATLKMNGIVCMKPKSQNAQYVPGEDGMSNLTPLMPDSTFFYVEQKTQVQQQQQE
ncbi:hypothetical protein BC830DRAFT_1127491 [Chytriomyces sp. MP71]|nr:hypothetical protein BC830DRAFT_1127491 [Chytriomyces sp. MP71]